MVFCEKTEKKVYGVKGIFSKNEYFFFQGNIFFSQRIAERSILQYFKGCFIMLLETVVHRHQIRGNSGRALHLSLVLAVVGLVQP